MKTLTTNKLFVYTIVGVVGVLVLVTAIWPLTEQRNAAVDRLIAGDFASISMSVDEYYSSEGRLPDDLDELDLSDEVDNRAQEHRYEIDKRNSQTYALCAEFKTDTRGQASSDDDVYSFSSFFYEELKHREGFDCIEYQTFGFSSFDSEEPSFFDFDGSFEDELENLDLQELFEGFDAGAFDSEVFSL